MSISKTFRVWGHVQGVSYRKLTQKVARHLGVNGWVRNVSNGTVEVFLDGDERLVDAVIAWCAFGPPKSKVDEIQVLEPGLGSGYNDFIIREDLLVDDEGCADIKTLPH
jgi:acylphosphatase